MQLDVEGSPTCDSSQLAYSDYTTLNLQILQPRSISLSAALASVCLFSNMSKLTVMHGSIQSCDKSIFSLA